MMKLNIKQEMNFKNMKQKKKQNLIVEHFKINNQKTMKS